MQLPGKHMKVKYNFLGNWIAVFRGSELMEMNAATCLLFKVG